MDGRTLKVSINVNMRIMWIMDDKSNRIHSILNPLLTADLGLQKHWLTLSQKEDFPHDRYAHIFPQNGEFYFVKFGVYRG